MVNDIYLLLKSLSVLNELAGIVGAICHKGNKTIDLLRERERESRRYKSLKIDFVELLREFSSNLLIENFIKIIRSCKLGCGGHLGDINLNF